MNITTKELIEVMNNNPMQEGRGRLSGRLDILEEWHKQEDCMDLCDCNKTVGDNKDCWLTEQIDEIKFALRGKEVKDGDEIKNRLET